MDSEPVVLKGKTRVQVGLPRHLLAHFKSVPLGEGIFFFKQAEIKDPKKLRAMTRCHPQR